MGIKDAYYYAFYKIYKFLELFARPNWLINSRARGLFSALQASFIWSLYFSYKILSNRSGNDGATLCVVLSIVIGAINLIVLYSDDRIKVYTNKFEGWPKEKNEHYTSIAAIIIFIIAFGFILSLFLYVQKFHPHK
jgi:quinol-cytochrome oxidoreductase complex cytochrome b subunit